ncbi:MAG: DNA polymerase III subunit beta [Saprospiraceae bacterium]|nr:DNA polymerase III subunit beta [Saprospiraceae bacterium]MBP7679592.1 DNA polymerase III subunit beta [Saprospiraceae bacterium]
MKFRVSSSELLRQVQIAHGAIASNPVLPILEDFLFVIDGNQLSISSTDLETSISTSIEIAESDSNGSIAIPAKILLDTLKALPSQPITFAINDNQGIEITSEYGRYKLVGEQGADFPKIPQAEVAKNITIPSQTLLHGINKTLFATSNDELRAAMSGVYFQIEPNALTFVATDAHRLVRYKATNILSDESTSFIVPKKALNLLKNALSAGTEVTLSFNNANAFFSFDNVNMVCRLIDARYPDYNAVIPTDNPSTLQIARNDFQNSLKRIAIYANKTTNQVVLTISDNSLNISAQDVDFSNEATEQQPCSFDGSPITIGFNAKFLIEMLGAMEGDEITLSLSTPSRAGVLRPTINKEHEDILMLVMPVMLHH